MTSVNTSKIEKVFNGYDKRRKSGGMSFYIESGDGNFQWSRESGDMAGDKPFGVASVSKLFTSALVLHLIDDGKIKLDDKIDSYLPSDFVDGLAVYKGTDYSHSLTIKNLLAQTSGIPDFYTEGIKGNIDMANNMSSNPMDELKDSINWIKAKGNCFPPNKAHKAHYSDTNFDLLCVIIEKVTGLSFAECVKKYITEPLSLARTSVFIPGSEIDFPGVWYKGKIIMPINVLSSGPASGGIISTIKELMVFIKAFWGGRLFSAEHIPAMQEYNPIQFIPLQYGVGHMKFAQFGCPTFIGHSGSTGVVCYYSQARDMYVCGTINECNEVKAIRMMIQLLLSVGK